MTINDAIAALEVPEHKRNDNCVQDAQARLREKLRLAQKFHADTEEAPDFVQKSVRSLQSWLAL